MTNLDQGTTGRRTNVSPETSEPKTPDDDAIATRLKAEHIAIEKMIQDAMQSIPNILPRAMKLGDDLQKVKDGKRHGEWLTWLAKTGIHERKARRYMELAKNREKIEEKVKSDTMSDLTMAGALRLANGKSSGGGGGGGTTLGEKIQNKVDDVVDSLDKLKKKQKDGGIEQAITEVSTAIEKLEAKMTVLSGEKSRQERKEQKKAA
jgi:hypothetical protein